MTNQTNRFLKFCNWMMIYCFLIYNLFGRTCMFDYNSENWKIVFKNLGKKEWHSQKKIIDCGWPAPWSYFFHSQNRYLHILKRIRTVSLSNCFVNVYYSCKLLRYFYGTFADIWALWVIIVSYTLKYASKLSCFLLKWCIIQNVFIIVMQLKYVL